MLNYVYKFHGVNDKLTFYERARASLGELRNHFKEAFGNDYVGQATNDRFSKNMNEVGFLLSRMMKNIRTARDSHEAERKSKRPSSRRVPGLPKLLSVGGTSNPLKVD